MLCNNPCSHPQYSNRLWSYCRYQGPQLVTGSPHRGRCVLPSPTHGTEGGT